MSREYVVNDVELCFFFHSLSFYLITKDEREKRKEIWKFISQPSVCIIFRKMTIIFKCLKKKHFIVAYVHFSIVTLFRRTCFVQRLVSNHFQNYSLNIKHLEFEVRSFNINLNTISKSNHFFLSEIKSIRVFLSKLELSTEFLNWKKKYSKSNTKSDKYYFFEIKSNLSNWSILKFETG